VPDLPPMWSEIKKAAALIRASDRILLIPTNFPTELIPQVLALPHVVGVQRSSTVPENVIYVVPAHPEDLALPPI